MPWGTVFVGMTTTCFSVRGMHCSAAMIMFLLFGRTKTVEAGVRLISWRISSVEGFIVWPPVTTPSAPSSRKSSSIPLPAQTATAPYCFSGAATTSSPSFMASSSFSTSSRSSVERALRPAATSSCWVRMFSIFASSSVPYFCDSVRAAPGIFVCTCTLNSSSPSLITSESPMEPR